MMSVEYAGIFYACIIIVVSYPRAGWLMPRQASLVLDSGKDGTTFCLTV